LCAAETKKIEKKTQKMKKRRNEAGKNEENDGKNEETKKEMQKKEKLRMGQNLVVSLGEGKRKASCKTLGNLVLLLCGGFV
jgi:sRNA-binding protein